jgi:hypothetical protein
MSNMRCPAGKHPLSFCGGGKHFVLPIPYLSHISTHISTYTQVPVSEYACQEVCIFVCVLCICACVFFFLCVCVCVNMSIRVCMFATVSYVCICLCLYAEYNLKCALDTKNMIFFSQSSIMS